MARLIRSKRNRRSTAPQTAIPAGLFWPLIAAAFCLAVLFSSSVIDDLLFLATFVAAPFLFFKWRKASLERFDQRLKAVISEHQVALVECYNRSRIQDPFGNIDDRKWHKQVDDFLKTKVVPSGSDWAGWKQGRYGRHALRIVETETQATIAAMKATSPLHRVDAATLKPSDYEHHCADLLRDRGWNVRVTAATRDGGADIVADRDGHRIVVQCKRYAKPVGNKAVQEVYSALSLYQGTVACVVAPVGYTAQAEREALALSIRLLHHSGLQDFADNLTRSVTA